MHQVIFATVTIITDCFWAALGFAVNIHTVIAAGLITAVTNKNVIVTDVFHAMFTLYQIPTFSAAIIETVSQLALDLAHPSQYSFHILRKSLGNNHLHHPCR